MTCVLTVGCCLVLQLSFELRDRLWCSKLINRFHMMKCLRLVYIHQDDGEVVGKTQEWNMFFA